jgi:hypothetical protein
LYNTFKMASESKDIKKNRQLLDYDDEYVAPPMGRINPDVKCYFNSLLAVLHSIPLFNRILVQLYDETVEGLSPFIKFYVQEFRECQESDPGSVIRNQSLFSIFMKCLEQYDKTHDQHDPNHTVVKNMKYYQEKTKQADMEEGLNLLLYMIDQQQDDSDGTIKGPIKSLFRYRHEIEYTCFKCNQICFRKKAHDVIHTISTLKKPNNKSTIYAAFVYTLQTSIDTYDKDYACSICNGWKTNVDDEDMPDSKKGNSKSWIRSDGIKSEILGLVSEIVAIRFVPVYDPIRQAYVKRTRYFPPAFRLKKSKANDYLYYKLVAQVEKTGNQHSGHYTTRCLRQDKVYEINDERINRSKFEPTPHTTMVVYHHYIPTKEDPYDDSHESYEP